MVSKERLVNLCVAVLFGFLGGFVANTVRPGTTVAAQQTADVITARTFRLAYRNGTAEFGIDSRGYPRLEMRNEYGNQTYFGFDTAGIPQLGLQVRNSDGTSFSAQTPGSLELVDTDGSRLQVRDHSLRLVDARNKVTWEMPK